MKTVTKHKNWVLVADGGEAKILTHFENGYQVIEHIKSPFQHIPSKDISTDKDGNFYSTSHHSKGNSGELHQQTESKFIAELADLLEKKYYAGRFNKLTLIMPPKALGEIRQNIDKNIKASVKQEIAKDLTQIPEQELLIRLEELL